MMFGVRLPTRITVAALILVAIVGAAVMFAENMCIHDEYLNELHTDMGTQL